MAAPVVTSGTPPGGITWTAFTVQFLGGSYPVSAGNTTNKFVWWRWNAGSPVVESGNSIPPTFDYVNDVLLFLNKSGVGFAAFTTSVVDGSLIVTGSILADSIGANQIVTAALATDSVSAIKIQADAVTASKILAGSITANKIAAGAVSADKLSIGAYTSNLALNPYFEEQDPLDSTWVTAWTKITGTGYTGASYTLEATNPISGVRSMKMSATAGQSAAVIGQFVPVAANEDFYLSAIVSSDAASVQTAAVGVWFYNKAGTFLGADSDIGNLATSMAYLQYTGSTPAGAAYAVPLLLTTSTSPTYWDNVEMGHRVTTVKIADGAITAQQVAAHTITANEIFAGTVTANEIASTYLYAGNIFANQIQTGVLAAPLVLGSSITTPVNASGGYSEMTSTGIRIVSPTATTTLSPTLSEFQGKATVSSLVVNGNATDTLNGVSLRGLGHEVARSAKVVLSNGVTAPSTAPSAFTDWAQVPLIGYDFTSQSVMDMQWDTTLSRWVVFVSGPTYVGARLFRADGTYDATTLGTDFPTSLGVVSAIRTPGQNYYLWNSGVGNYSVNNGSTGLAYVAMSSTAPLAMAWDGTNIVVAEGHTVGAVQNVRLTKYNPNTAAGSNLITNGTFEANLAGWTMQGGGGANNWTYITGANVITGTGSVQITTNTISTLYAKTGLANRPAVTPRVKYTFSFKAKHLTGGPGGKIIPRINYYNSAGSLLSAGIGAGTTTTTTAGLISITATADDTAAYAECYITMPLVDSTFVIDDATFTTAAGLSLVGSQELVMSKLTTADSLYYGDGDFGAKHWVVGSTIAGIKTACAVPEATPTEDATNKSFQMPLAAVALGYDGTNFWTLGVDNKLYKHEVGTKTVANATTWKLVSTFQDTVGGFETPISAPSTLTLVRRARLNIGVAQILKTGLNDPNSIGVYGTNVAAATPVRTDYHLLGTTPDIPVIAITDSLAGANPLNPATNGFPSTTSVPGEIASAGSFPQISLKGDGSGQTGAISWDATGTVTTSPYKAWCRAASTVNIASLSTLLTVDGLALNTGDRVLVKDQTTGSANGIYIAQSGAWTRATDLNTTGKVAGAHVPVQSGLTQAGSSWMVIGWAGTLGSSAIIFQPLTGTPSGSIMMWPTATAPAGWLLCNGQSTTGYPALTAMFGATVPDYTGKFLIGAGTAPSGRVVPLGQTSGTDTITTSHLPPHTHATPNHQHPYDRSSGTAAGSSGLSLASGTTTISNSAAIGAYNPNNAGGGTTGDGSFTNASLLPPYSAINFIVKT